MIRSQIYFFMSLPPGFFTSMADSLLTVSVSPVLRRCKYKPQPGKQPDIIDTVLMCQGNKGNKFIPIAQKKQLAACSQHRFKPAVPEQHCQIFCCAPVAAPDFFYPAFFFPSSKYSIICIKGLLENDFFPTWTCAIRYSARVYGRQPTRRMPVCLDAEVGRGLAFDHIEAVRMGLQRL